MVGYHGTLLTQTMTFAADEFGAGTAAQGDALAAVRIGGVIAIGLGAVGRPPGAAAHPVRRPAGVHRRDGGRRLGAQPGGAGRHPGRQPGRGARRRCCWPSSPPRRCPPAPRLRAEPAVDDRGARGRRRPVAAADRRPVGPLVAGCSTWSRCCSCRSWPGSAGSSPRAGGSTPAPQRPAGRPLLAPGAGGRDRASCSTCSWPPSRSSATSSCGTSGACRRPSSRCSSSSRRRRRASGSSSAGAWPTPGAGGWSAPPASAVGTVLIAALVHRPGPCHVGVRPGGRHRRRGAGPHAHGLRARAVPHVAAGAGQRLVSTAAMGGSVIGLVAVGRLEERLGSFGGP